MCSVFIRWVWETLISFIIFYVHINLISSRHLLGYQENVNPFDYHYVVQDAKNNVGDQAFAPDTLSQTIQGNFYEQTPQKLEAKPCTRRSNSESDNQNRRQDHWSLPPAPNNVKLSESSLNQEINDNQNRRQDHWSLPPAPNNVKLSESSLNQEINDNQNRRQDHWSLPPAPNNVKLSESSLNQEINDNQNRRQDHWSLPPAPNNVKLSESSLKQEINDNQNRRQEHWSLPPAPNNVKLSESSLNQEINDNQNRRQDHWSLPPAPNNVKLSESSLKQGVRRNDPNPKSADNNQELDANAINFPTSRSAITINKTPLEFEGDHDLKPSYLRDSLSDARLPGFEASFAPSGVFDMDLPNDFFTVPSPPIKVNPSEDVNYKPFSDLQSKLLHTESENDAQIRSAKPDLRRLDSKNIPKPETTKCSNVNNTRRSYSSYNDDSSYGESDKYNSDKESQNYNDQYDQSRNGNEKALNSVLYQDKNLNPNNEDEDRKSLIDSDKPKSTGYQSVTRLGRPQFNEARRNEIIEPTRGSSNIGQSQLLLMQTERICYACSTANNPTCWAPDRRTTVKYCKKGNNACITKTFGSGSSFTLIRDCGRSCDDSDMGGLMPKYKSCSMCHSELCNGAYSVNGQSILFTLVLTAFIKYLN
ncbi:unnamed protein product [Chrysodeixis includens]|uniref:Uncharacterized protein n=1 Tax=Chrysodeixis includens TaxID=689277 RepID=A0A9P0BSR5_CHRIL|nr:unnamed protein product [Chrysodeixis includens]